MKIALVHDFLTKLGGAENVLQALHEAFPDAPVYTLLYDKAGTKNIFEKGYSIQTSSLQKYPALIRKRPKFLFAKFPKAIEEFDFSDFDVVISSSNAFAHGIITSPATLHICYCHSPMRYVWDWHNEYLKENNIGYNLIGLYIRNLIHNIRIWDKVSSHRVDYWLANSATVQGRITKYYQKDSEILYPPVEVVKIGRLPATQEDFYLIVSRLEPYKRADLAVETFNRNGKKLIIIGEGSQFDQLQKVVKSNITLLGWQSNQTIYEYLTRARAFVFPVEDDFGITPVEAMAAGKPVIALNKGGVRETVIAEKTGVFFNEPTTESLQNAIDHFEQVAETLTPENCRQRAVEFSRENFLEKIQTIIARELKNFQIRSKK